MYIFDFCCFIAIYDVPILDRSIVIRGGLRYSGGRRYSGAPNLLRDLE